MKLTTTNRSEVKEVPYGVYVWQTPDGEFLGDGDGNFMLIFSTEGNQDSIKKITEAARHYGYPEGKPVFWSGKRPITDEEYEEQLMRERLGMVPDPLDYGAIRDEAKAAKAKYDRA